MMKERRAQAAQQSCSQAQSSAVQDREAQASLQNTRLSRRTPPSSATVHWQLAQAHFVRCDRWTGFVALEVFFIVPPSQANA